MTEENLKMIAQSIAKKPLVQRYLEILRILEDLNVHIEQTENRTSKYIA
jgi:hypothetical protein